MKYIRLTKYAAVENPVHPSANMDTYEMGVINSSVSLPIEYWLEGYLPNLIEVGKKVLVYRRVRNGVKTDGEFISTPVKEITPEGFNTQSSKYKLEVLTDVETTV